MKENSEKQAPIYVRPKVELIDIKLSGVICSSGGTVPGNVTAQDPDDPTYA